MKKGFIFLIILSVSFSTFSQDHSKTLDDYIRTRTYDDQGNEIIGVIVPGHPPETHREPVAAPSRSAVVLTNVPAYDWSFGCSATSAAMAAGYYDINGYPDMYTGPTNGGVAPMNNSVWGTVMINGEVRSQCPISASRLGLDGRLDTGHVDDYWIQYNSQDPDPYITNGWTQHGYDSCTADFMGTNQSELGNVDGSTIFFLDPSGAAVYNYTGHEPDYIDGCHGLRDFYESRGYTVISNYTQYIYGYNGNTIGFTFEQYKNEIDAGRPVMIQVVGHSMLGYGYDASSNLVYLHDTWDYSSHTMTWGGSYAGLTHYAVTVVELEPSVILPIADFIANATTPRPDSIVVFTDLSLGNPTSWQWEFSPDLVTYHNGTSSSSQNPRISFDTTGFYTVSLIATNANGNDSEIKANYIHAFSPGLWTGTTSTDWNTASNWDGGTVPSSSTPVIISADAPYWPLFPGDFIVGSNCDRITFDSTTQMNISGNFTISPGKTVDMTAGGLLTLSGDWYNDGVFIPGTGTVAFTGNSSQTVHPPVLNVSTYLWETFTKGMTPLENAYLGPTGDDGSTGNIPVGFTFLYDNVEYNEIRMCTNGWISLNESGSSSVMNQDLFTSTAPNTTLAPWWDDLKDDGSSFLYYKTEGTAPNRVFTAEWRRVYSFFSGATARLFFQVKLFETTNVIEFHYGDMETGTHYSAESASIGIEDATGGSGHFIEATTGSSTTGISNLKSETQWPTVNYRFSPPSLCQEFHNVVINNSLGTINLEVNTEINGNLSIFPGATVNVSSGNTITISENVMKK